MDLTQEQVVQQMGQVTVPSGQSSTSLPSDFNLFQSPSPALARNQLPSDFGVFQSPAIARNTGALNPAPETNVQQASTWKTFTQGKLLVQYPENWSCKLEDGKLFLISPKQTENRQVRDNINLQKIQGATIEEIYDSLTKQFNSLPVSQVFPSQYMSIGNYKAIEFKSKYTYNGANYEQLTAVADVGVFCYVIAYTSSAGFMHESIYHQILQQVQLG